MVFFNFDLNMIELILFLKDVVFLVIYGFCVVYGVVLVMIKGGKVEKMNVVYSGYVGVKILIYLLDVFDLWDYVILLNEVKYNVNFLGGKNQVYMNEEIGWFRDGSNFDYYLNMNWVDLVLDKYVLII